VGSVRAFEYWVFLDGRGLVGGVDSDLDISRGQVTECSTDPEATLKWNFGKTVKEEVDDSDSVVAMAAWEGGVLATAG
jgi:hypothetical protein